MRRFGSLLAQVRLSGRPPCTYRNQGKPPQPPAMLRAAIPRAALRRCAAPASAMPAAGVVTQHVRHLNIHEYQSSALMEKMGVNVPFGIAVQTVEEAVAAAAEIGDDEVVIKSQVLAGGRGLGTFTSGMVGGVHIIKSADVEEYASQMLGSTLVTLQTDGRYVPDGRPWDEQCSDSHSNTDLTGKPVNTLLLAKKMQLVNEMYFAILLDRVRPRPPRPRGPALRSPRSRPAPLCRADSVRQFVQETQGPMVIACAEGGTSIEELAATNPDAIVKVPIDPGTGMTDENAAEIVAGLKCSGDLEAAKGQVQALYKLFTEADCTMVEVNPLAEDPDGTVIAADAKIGFDDNAAFRQSEIFEQRDTTQEDQREVEASKWDLNYIGLDGNIGCMVNGAGLAIATMDIVSAHGGTPANFLDVGGSANEEQITEAFKIISSDSQVQAILVNIFGGIARCDTIANGVIGAVRATGLSIPLVVRLEGTNVEAGLKLIADAQDELPTLIPASDLDDAAKKAVAAIA